MKFISTIVFLILLSSNIFSQSNWKWQDPLEFNRINFGDKYLILTNTAAIALNILLTDKDSSILGLERWHFSAYAEYQKEYERNETNLYSLNARLGYFIRKWLNVGGELRLSYMENSNVNTPALGTNVFFNWYIINKKSWKLIYDNGAGIVLSPNEFPKGGTHFNFYTFYGISTYIQINNRKYINLGVRTMHLSNAYLFGDDNNPAFDSIGGFVGVTF